jgi:putative flippase GtrA
MIWNAIRRLSRTYRQALVFGLIGVCNTVLHSATVVFLVERTLAAPVTANVAGFAMANTFSYFANARLTFRQPPSWALYGRFALVSLGSLILTIALSALAEYLHWHYLAGLAMVILCGPVLSYALHSLFTFAKTAAIETGD